MAATVSLQPTGGGGGGGTGLQHTPRHQPTSSSLLACMRESSPLDPLDAPQNVEPSKKRRFHPFRNLRRMFRRKSRAGADSAPEPQQQQQQQAEVCAQPDPAAAASLGLMVHHDPHRSRSASELLAAEEQAKRRSGGGLSCAGSSSNCSGAALASSGLSVSHDSVFTSDQRASPRSSLELHPDLGSSAPLNSASALNLQPLATHAGVRAELFEAVRRRRGRREGSGQTGGSEDDEDLGLPRSPCGSPTTADVLLERSGIKEVPKSQSTCSDGSLLSMGSSEMDEDSQMSGHSSKLSLHDRSHDSAVDMGLEMGEAPHAAPLSHSAAKHKMAVRPRRTHGAPRHRRMQQVVSASLPTTPEANEEFSRSLSPGSRSKKDLALGLPDVTTAAVTVARSPPCGISSHSPEALLANVLLQRQLKSASLPPGLAPPSASSTAAAAASEEQVAVKLARSKSSSDGSAPSATSPPGRPVYRRAISAVRSEQAALANAAVSRSRKMFGSDAKEQEEVMKEEVKKEENQQFFNRAQLRKADEVKPEPLSPKPTSPTKFVDEIPQEVPMPAVRKMSAASSRQRFEPSVLATSPTKESVEPAQLPWTPSPNKVSVSHFFKLAPINGDQDKPSPPSMDANDLMTPHRPVSFGEPEVVLRNKDIVYIPPAENPNRLSVKSKVSDYKALINDSPSSLTSVNNDSLEMEWSAQVVRKQHRSLSQSPVDSLERQDAALKMSSDSLSSGTELSSTSASEDPRPVGLYTKNRRSNSRRSTQEQTDTSDADEAKTVETRPIKLRSISRHSDPPFTAKNSIEIKSMIRKSSSADSIRSFGETSNAPTYEPENSNCKSTSTDSMSSYENLESENHKKNSIVIQDKGDFIKETHSAIVSDLQGVKLRQRSSTYFEETKPVDITPLESSRASFGLRIAAEHKTESDGAGKSPPIKWEAKPRLSLSTPNVPEFLRVQLNHVDSKPISNIVLSTTSQQDIPEPPKKLKTSLNSENSEKSLLKQDSLERFEEPEVAPSNEIFSTREKLLRKSSTNAFFDEPKVVELSEKVVKQPVEISTTTENNNGILNRRPSQVKKFSQELFIKASETDSKSKVESLSPTEKSFQRISSSFIQPKISLVSLPPTPQPAKVVAVIPQEHHKDVKEEPSPSLAAKPQPAEKPAELNNGQEGRPEVVLRKKSIARETNKKDDEPELFKVFARRSLKLKDSDTWEGQQTAQKSRDSDKENEGNDSPKEIQAREKKVKEALAEQFKEKEKNAALSSSINNNNLVPDKGTTSNNINNLFLGNNQRRAQPRAAVVSAPPSNNNNNNNNEAFNTEIAARHASPEKRTRRPDSNLADKMQRSVWAAKDIELVGETKPTPVTPAVPPPAPEAQEVTPDKTLTPKVRRRMEEWERWAQQASRKEALP